MNLVEIQELIKFVAKSGVNEVELEIKDFKITIKSDYLAKKKTGSFIPETQTVKQTQQPVVAPVVMPTNSEIDPEKVKAASDEEKYVTIKSPIIGTFYRAASPDKPPFVSVGDNINVGDVICIVEAMKLFNEIESEVSGRIVKVLIDDAKPVEYDTPLFIVDPS